MRSRRINRVWDSALFAIAFGTLAVTGNQAFAAIYSWSTTGGTAWSASSDWLPGGLPTATDTALFAGSTYSKQPSTSTTPQSVGAIWDIGSGTVTISGSSAGILTLAGTTISTNNGVGIELDAGAGSLTISAPVALGASQLWINNDNKPITVSGVVSGASTSTLTKTGTGTLILSGSNTYSGGTTLNLGTLQVVGSSALGTGPLSFTGNATLQAGANVTVPNNIALGTNSATFGTNGSTLTVTGSVGNTGTSGIPITVGGNFTLVLAGPLSLSGIPNNTNDPAIMMNAAGAPLEILTITGTGTLSGISMGWANTRKTLNLQPAGTLTLSNTADSLDVGQGAGTLNGGEINQSSGTVNALGTISLGMWDSSYGNYNLSGGVLNALHVYSGGNGNAAGNSLFLQTGGTANIGSTDVGTNNSGTNVLHLSAGTYNNLAGNLILGNGTAGLGVATVTGGSLTVNGNIVVSNSTAATGILNLNGGVTTANAVLAGVSNGTSIVNFNGGTLVAGSNASTTFLSGLSSANVYAGGASINTNGQNITIGQSLLAASGSGVSSVTLTGSGTGYVGAPVITIGGGGGSGATAEAVINSSGVVTGITITNPGSGYTSAPTVTFGGAGTSASGTVALAANIGTGGLTKNGAGVLTLGGYSNYVGPTVVNNGTLAVTGSLGNTAVSVASGTALSGGGNAGLGNGIIGGSVTVNGGAAMTLALGDSTTSLTINNGLTLSNTGTYGAGNYTTLNYTVGNNGIEGLGLGSSTLTLDQGGAYVDVIPTVTLGGTSTYTLMSFGSQVGSGQFSLSPIASNVTTETIGRATLSLADSANSLQLTITGPSTPPVAYFYGNAPTSAWNDLSSPTSSNWSLDITGTQDAGNIPGPTTDVILSASTLSGSVVSTTLGASTTINSLNVGATAGSTTINADGSTLTINALGDNNVDATGSYTGNSSGNGISIAAGAGPVTINVPVLLGLGNTQTSQTWTNGSANTLTITGSVAGTATAGNLQTLILVNSNSGGTTIGGAVSNGTSGGSLALVVNNSGPGFTTLSGSNSYTGGTTLTAGTLALGNAAALSTGSVVINGGQLDLAGISPTFTTLNGSGGTLTNNLNVTAATLTVNSGNYSGSIDDGQATIALVKAGNGTLTLSGSNAFSGNSTISAGALTIGGAGVLGQGGIYSGNIAIAASSSLLNFNSTAAETFSGTINGSGGLTESAGLLTLTGSDSYGNGTTVSGGTLTVSPSGTVADNSSTGLNINGGVVNILGTYSKSGISYLKIENNGVLNIYGTVNWFGNDGTRIAAGSSGTLNIYSGSVTLSTPLATDSFNIGFNSGTGVANVMGGTLAVINTNTLNIGGNALAGDTGQGILNIGGSGVVVMTGTGGFNVGGTSASGGTINLNAGGMLQTSLPIKGGLGTAIFNFNGGTLVAEANSINFLALTGSNDFAYVQSGGALINTNSYNITIGQSLVGTTNDGGLTKLGLGTLTLSGSNTYVGGTTVNGGTLTAAALNTLSPSSAVTVNPGTLDVTTAAQQIGSLAIGSSGTLNLSIGNLLSSNGTASFAAGSTLNISGTIAALPEVLMTYMGAANGTFTNVNFNGGSLPGDDQLYYSSGGSLEIIAAGPPMWIQSSGSWSAGTNWSSGSQPNALGQAAVLNQSNSGSVAITLDVPVTIGSLQFASSTTSYALGGGTLTFNNNGGTSYLTVASGTHSIGSLVVVASGNLDVSASNNSVLSISGNIADDGGNRSLTLAGDGTGQLILSGSNTYGGGTTVSNGVLVLDGAASLLTGSSLTIGSAVSPGAIFSSPLAVSREPATNLAPVPEPGTLALLTIAACSAAVYRIRFRATKRLRQIRCCFHQSPA